MVMRKLQLYYSVRSSLDLNQQVEVRWWASGPDEWAVLHQATHLRLIQCFDTRPVQEVADTSNAAQLPRSGPRYLLDMTCV